MTDSNHDKQLHVSNKAWFIIGITLLFMALIIPQLGDFKAAISTIKDADISWLVLGFITSMSTFLASALTYVNISLKPLSYIKTLAVQVSNGFANKLLPAGAGGMTVNGRYLYKAGHNATQAASVVGLNNVLGFIGFLIAMLLSILINHSSLSDTFHLKAPSKTVLILAAVIVVAAVIALCIRKVRAKIIQVVKEVIDTLHQAMKRPLNLALGTLGQTALPLLFTTTLFLSALALGVNLSLLQAFYVFTIGQAAASVTPTPGGIGGAEAGLTAALISIGVDNSDAIAIALTYRFLTYWLPMIPGVFMFRHIIRKKYI